MADPRPKSLPEQFAELEETVRRHLRQARTRTTEEGDTIIVPGADGTFPPGDMSGFTRGAFTGPQTPIGAPAASIGAVAAATPTGVATEPNSTVDGPYTAFSTALSSYVTIGSDSDPPATVLGFRRQYDPSVVVKFALESTTTIRAWVGLSTPHPQGMNQFDNPSSLTYTGPYIGIQYSTARGDTTWKLIHKSSTQVVVDTGVPISTTTRALRIDATESAASFRVRIYDGNWNELFDKDVGGSQIPVATQTMRLGIGVRSLAAATKVYRVWYGLFRQKA